MSQSNWEHLSKSYGHAMPSVPTLWREAQPPCQAACPAGIDIRMYIALIAQRCYVDAIRVIRERMPFPSICGRICYHPCEADCNRGLVDEPLAIMHLKRFAVDREFEAHLLPGAVDKTKAEKAAVIGGGLSGLTAAQDLTRMGYHVTVFEALPFLGGTLRIAMPGYRLPREVLDWDVQNILALGIEAQTDLTIGKDISLEELRKQGYQAIFIATGSQRSRKLSQPRAGIIAEGDLVSGTVWAVDVVAAGHKAALAIDRYLCGEPLAIPIEHSLPVARMEKAELQGRVLKNEIKLRPQAEMPLWEPEKGPLGSEEMYLGFTEEIAVGEALRCLSCGAVKLDIEKCAICLTCLRVCPYEVPTITEDETINIRLERCRACGICVGECPAGAITLKHYQQGQVIEKIRATIAEASCREVQPLILGLWCTYSAHTVGDFTEFVKTKCLPNVVVLTIPCVAKIDTIHLLKAFELGADGVFIVSCIEEDCLFQEGISRARRRIDAAKKILSEIGLEGDRLEMYNLSAPDVERFDQVVAMFTEQIRSLLPTK